MKAYKYQAAGNDFILLVPSPEDPAIQPDGIIRMCDRRMGIGSDGLIILETDDEYDFSMRFYNNDASEGMMCGNGGRCIIDLADRLGLRHRHTPDAYIFKAPDGIHSGRILSRKGNTSRIHLGMNDVGRIEKIPVGKYDSISGSAYKMNTGCEHLVIFKNDIRETDITEEGRKWRYDSMFAPKGVNVDFVEILSPGRARVRTYEKGVEYETPSCGTGVIASAIACFADGCGAESYEILTAENTFKVGFLHEGGMFTEVYIEGDTELVFTAEYHAGRISWSRS